MPEPLAARTRARDARTRGRRRGHVGQCHPELDAVQRLGAGRAGTGVAGSDPTSAVAWVWRVGVVVNTVALDAGRLGAGAGVMRGVGAGACVLGDRKSVV